MIQLILKVKHCTLATGSELRGGSGLLSMPWNENKVVWMIQGSKSHSGPQSPELDATILLTTLISDWHEEFMANVLVLSLTLTSTKSVCPSVLHLILQP